MATGALHRSYVSCIWSSQDLSRVHYNKVSRGGKRKKKNSLINYLHNLQPVLSFSACNNPSWRFPLTKKRRNVLFTSARIVAIIYLIFLKRNQEVQLGRGRLSKQLLSPLPRSELLIHWAVTQCAPTMHIVYEPVLIFIVLHQLCGRFYLFCPLGDAAKRNICTQLNRLPKCLSSISISGRFYYFQPAHISVGIGFHCILFFSSAFAFNEAFLARWQEWATLRSVCSKYYPPNHWQAHLKPRGGLQTF